MAEPQHEEVNAEIAGQKFSYKGIHFGNVLQMAIVGVGVWAAITFAQTQQSASEEHKKLSAAIETQSKVLEKQLEAQQEFNYIITLKQERREALNLQMPPSLRDKIREFR